MQQRLVDDDNKGGGLVSERLVIHIKMILVEQCRFHTRIRPKILSICFIQVFWTFCHDMGVPYKSLVPQTQFLKE